MSYLATGHNEIFTTSNPIIPHLINTFTQDLLLTNNSAVVTNIRVESLLHLKYSNSKSGIASECYRIAQGLRVKTVKSVVGGSNLRRQ